MMILNALKFVWRHTRVWLLVSVIILALVFTATMVATQNDFLSGTIDTVMGGSGRALVSGDPERYNRYEKTADFKQFTTDLKLGGVVSTRQEKTDVLAAADLLNEEIAGEGFVLLKNENDALPLATSAQNKAKISVFGKNSVNLVYGGSGSGGGNADSAVTLYEGLENAGFSVNPTLKKFYDGNASGKGRDANPAITGAAIPGLAIGETPQKNYTDEVKNSYDEYGDAAVIVISRIGGEGFDLPRLQRKSYNGELIDGSQEEGQHYLEIDQNEEDLIDAVIASGKFAKVILLVNCATSMELGFVGDNAGIDAALWIGSPGGSGANAIGKILSGEVNPSGRLVDTYVRDFTLDPTWANFGDNLTSGGNAYLTGGVASGYYFAEYEEGIYSGYRYYETRSYQNVVRFGTDYGWYDEAVVYPFGYGLSYTEDFVWTLAAGTTPSGSALTAKDGKIDVKVNVKNNGTRAGKDVVQVYCSAPYVNNGIEKAHVVLAGSAKTKLLAPQEEQEVTVSVSLEDLASYDFDDSNGNGFKGFELDAGLYTLYVGRNAHAAWADEGAIALAYSLPEGFTYEADIDGAADGDDNQFDDMSAYMEGKTMTRASFNNSFPTTPTAAEREINSDLLNSFTYKYDDVNGEYMQSFAGDTPVQGKEGAAPQLYEMVGLSYGDAKWDDLLDHLTAEEMTVLVGQGNFHTEAIDAIGKPRTIDPDGPAGFTNFMGDPTVHDTCFYASECVIAATWNCDLAYDMGIMIGLESLVGYTNGDGRPYSGWYAPAVNIHRSPFSGRNWEYYSEDPYLSGIMGANVVKGAKSKGVYTFVKHFALNDQETNRDAQGLVTWADEQTFREVYLKPFRMIVEIGGTTGMMSSFNRIGAVWAGGSYALLTNVLRGEWGFEGAVISDYNISNAYMPPDQMIRAGGDLNLSQDYKPSATAKSDGMTDAVQLKALRQATKNILYTIANSNAMNGVGEGVVWRTTMAGWKIMLICVNVGLLVASAVWGVFAVRHARKKERKKAIGQ